MERYAEGFVDNGYEDFETVKQMGRADLETVGVADYHMEYMLSAVAVLQQKARAYWLVDFFSRPFTCFFGKWCCYISLFIFWSVLYAKVPVLIRICHLVAKFSIFSKFQKHTVGSNLQTNIEYFFNALLQIIKLFCKKTILKFSENIRETFFIFEFWRKKTTLTRFK